MAGDCFPQDDKAAEIASAQAFEADKTATYAADGELFASVSRVVGREAATMAAWRRRWGSSWLPGRSKKLPRLSLRRLGPNSRVARDVVITVHLAGLLEARVELAEARPTLANAPALPVP
jgi:hypothetical protein